MWGWGGNGTKYFTMSSLVIYIWPKTHYSDNVVVKTLSALKDNALALSMIFHIM